jgi:hypothetical protein
VTILPISAKWYLLNGNFTDFLQIYEKKGHFWGFNKKEPLQNMQQSIKAKSRPARKQATSGAFGKTS